MKVYIVFINTWVAYEGTETQLRSVFSTEDKALDYIKENSKDEYNEPGGYRVYFEVTEATIDE